MPSKREPDWAIELHKQHLASQPNPPTYANWKAQSWRHDNEDAKHLVEEWLSGKRDFKSSDFSGLYKSDPRWWKYAHRTFADNINNLRKRHQARLQLRKDSKSGKNTTPKASNLTPVDVNTGTYISAESNYLCSVPSRPGTAI